MNAILPGDWQRFLALPAGIYDPKQSVAPEALAGALANYERVAAGREYAKLTQRPEFQQTLALLRAYRAAVGSPRIDLPPPPR
jgi:hypothetical protein